MLTAIGFAQHNKPNYGAQSPPRRAVRRSLGPANRTRSGSALELLCPAQQRSLAPRVAPGAPGPRACRRATQPRPEMQRHCADSKRQRGNTDGPLRLLWLGWLVGCLLGQGQGPGPSFGPGPVQPGPDAPRLQGRGTRGGSFGAQPCGMSIGSPKGSIFAGRSVLRDHL